MAYRLTFKCIIMSPKSLLYENEVTSVFITGDQGEYELLPYHYPLVGIVKDKSHIIIDWKESVPVNKGIVRFFANECIILIEERQEETSGAGKK